MRQSKVCVIGAGAAGLIALNVLKQHYLLSSQTIIKCFEARAKVGGIWNYDGKTKEKGPIYKNLK